MRRDSKRGPLPASPVTGARFAVVVLGFLLVLGLDVGTAQAAPCDAPIQNEIVCENSKPGDPPSEWDVSGAGDSNIQGFATDISVNQGADRRLQGRHRRSSDYRLDIYRMGYYGGDGARKVATVEPSACAAPEPAGLPRRTRPAWSTAATGPLSASWDVPADAVSGIYFAKLVREDGTDGASHIVFVVRDDDGELGPPLPDLRHDLAGLQPVRRQQPLHGLAGEQPRPRLQGQLQPSVHDPRADAGGLGVQRRVPDGPLARAQRLRRQLLHRRRQRPPRRARSSSTRRSSRSATTSTGRPVSARTSRRLATPASTSRSSAATSRSGRRAGRTASTGPTPRTARSSPTRRRTRTRRSTRPPNGPAPGATSRLQPRGPATRERADRDDLHGQLRHLGDPGAGGRRQAAALAATRTLDRWRRARPRRSATAPSATSGTRTSTTAPARRGWSSSPRRPAPESKSCRTTARPTRPGPRPTT